MIASGASEWHSSFWIQGNTIPAPKACTMLLSTDYLHTMVVTQLTLWTLAECMHVHLDLQLHRRISTENSNSKARDIHRCT